MTNDYRHYVGMFEQKPDGTRVAVYASVDGVYLRQENRRNCARDYGTFLYIPYTKCETFEQTFRRAVDDCRAMRYD